MTKSHGRLLRPSGLVPAGIGLLLMLVSAPTFADEGPPLLDYQKMQELKLRLAGLLWEVEVLPKPDHLDIVPESVPRRYGQGVLVSVPQRGPRLLVSGDLVRGWSSLDAKANQARRCTPVEIREIEALNVAFIRCKESLADSTSVPLAPDEIAVEGALVFSLDNPAGNMPSMYHGFLAGPAEAPLAEFHYTHVGGVLSYPLLNHRGELVALTLRRLRPRPDTLSLAVTCRQLRRHFTPRRRDPAGPARLRESDRRPFHFE